MEKILFIVKFKNGSEYRVFTENKAQKSKLLRKLDSIKENIKNIETIDGLHSQKDFFDMLEVMSLKSGTFFERLTAYLPTK